MSPCLTRAVKMNNSKLNVAGDGSMTLVKFEKRPKSPLVVQGFMIDIPLSSTILII